MEQIIFPMLTDRDQQLPLVVVSVGRKSPQEGILRPDGHADYQWLQVLQGEGSVVIGGITFLLSSGSGLLFRPGIPHQYQPLTHDWTTQFVTFQGPVAPVLFQSFGCDDFAVLRLQDMAGLEAALDDVIRTAGNPHEDCASRLFSLLLLVRRNTGTAGTGVPYDKQRLIRPVTDYIQTHYDEPLTLETLAAIAGVSQTHLCRLFRQVFSMRPFEYLATVRLSKAKELMVREAHQPIHEIARRSGYQDTSYFCAQFRAREGVSPTTFRRLHGL